MASCIVLVAATLCVLAVILVKPNPTNSAEIVRKERIIIDTDGGVDDAIAILTVLGDPHLSQTIQGITCVRGITEVNNVVINILKTLKIADRLDVPVYSGAANGLMESPDTGHYYGNDGMGDANYPEPPPISIVKKTHAAVYLASIVNEYPGEITILMIGPMTNIALALRLNPKFMSQVKRLIALGGSVRGAGSMRPNVEFNVYMDPHAASVTMHGLEEVENKMALVVAETIRENFIEKEWRKMKLGKINNTKVDFINRIEKKELAEEGNYWYTYDLYVATVLLRPQSILLSKPLYVDFETEGKLTKGVFMVDYNKILNKTANADIIFSIDKRIIKSVTLENFS
ncbi:uncharacterized protein LOC142323708 [Lycorma delicatula]|uniref:uncharacterized protein LOC142323708 n=1 Tax=Lycorma delicatula TaxID=130591 RepID=UPI003F511DEF